MLAWPIMGFVVKVLAFDFVVRTTKFASAPFMVGGHGVTVVVSYGSWSCGWQPALFCYSKIRTFAHEEVGCVLFE
jgi:hypothetical protein